jgi:murein DD-endopeptidase MepM/ murein hydrolase activator NlpD
MSSKACHSAWGSSASKVLLSAAAAALLAACSADADRLASNPSDADPVYTASVPKRVTAANVGTEDEIASKPLTGASSKSPSYDYSQAYRPQTYRQPAVAPQPQPAIAGTAPATGGSTVTVGPGMTLYSIARANNLSVTELAAANGISPPYSVHTGQTLRIPGSGGSRAAASYAEPETAPAPPAKPFKQGPSVSDDGSGATHTVANGETLFSLGRKYGLSPFAIAEANGLPRDAQLTTGQKVRIPSGATPVAVKQPSAPKLDTGAPADDADEAVSTDIAAAPAPAAPAAPKQVTEQAPIDGAPGMRWPVRGKVISGFGPKANGLKNEGINIAVPEGTSIRAAESGVVAYAGNELKGYGNLVLIRHENGYVTAYAHAKELFVKRGDTVKRGDVIAKAGQTGSVSSPQLHFEVRKGATALDPMKFLSSSTASN